MENNLPQKRQSFLRKFYLEIGTFLAILASIATIYGVYKKDPEEKIKLIHNTVPVADAKPTDSLPNNDKNIHKPKTSRQPVEQQPVRESLPKTKSILPVQKEISKGNPTRLVMQGSVHMDRANLDGNAYLNLSQTDVGQWKMTGHFSGGVIGEVEMFGSGLISDDSMSQKLRFTGKVSAGTLVARCSCEINVDTQLNIVEGTFERAGVPNDRVGKGLPESGSFSLNISQKLGYVLQ